MVWFSALVVIAFLLAVGIWFLQRYFAKATLETSLVRTGLGGRRVVMDGGCLALPILHQLQRVSMAAIPVSVERTGRTAVMCSDQLRADVAMEFEFKVAPSAEGIAAAAQSLGMRTARGGGAIQELIEGFLIDAIQNAAATRTLADIHLNRSSFTQEVAAAVDVRAAKLGLGLISASLIAVDQASTVQLDENNAFNAQAMRRLAEMVSEQRKARVAVEAEAETAIRESKLQQRQRQLEILRSEQELEIEQREHLSRLEADADSRSSQARAEADLAAESVRIEKDREAKQAQVSNDEALRISEMAAVLALEEAKISNDIKLARMRAEEAGEKAKEEEARAQVILAAENVQAQKERAVAEREREVAHLKQKKDLELENARVKSDVDTLLAKAKAKASAATAEAAAERDRMEAEAAGRTALYSAENSLNEAVIRMRLEERKLDRMPEIMTQMMKPVEKIDSIKINQISGIGNGTLADAGSSGTDSAFGAAMDQILGMAVRLPAMKQMGEEIGLDFDAQTAGRTADYANRIKPRKDDKS